MVQLQATSQPAASPELPLHGTRHAAPVCGSIPLGVGHRYFSTTGPIEPPTGLPTRVPPVQGVNKLWSPLAPPQTRG